MPSPRVRSCQRAFAAWSPHAYISILSIPQINRSISGGDDAEQGPEQLYKFTCTCVSFMRGANLTSLTHSRLVNNLISRWECVPAAAHTVTAAPPRPPRRHRQVWSVRRRCVNAPVRDFGGIDVDLRDARARCDAAALTAS